MKARMIVPFDPYEQGEIVRNATAEKMVEDGYAVEIKMADSAPETKVSGTPKSKEKKAK